MEDETYNYYYLYDPEIVEKMKKWFHLNQKNTILSLIKLKKHKDILEEFYAGMKGETFCLNSTTPVEVEGYTAQKLFDNFSLSELGAYNYLIYLREDREKALSDLEKGLPRK